MKIKILLLFILIASLTISVAAQTSDDENVTFLKSKLFDAGSAEYKLTVDEITRGIQFTNNSKFGIRELQFGCVERKEESLKIIAEKVPVKVSIKATTKNTRSSLTWYANHGAFPIFECEEGKLAIIRVRLKKGRIWELK
jgi:hypothetical protein